MKTRLRACLLALMLGSLVALGTSSTVVVAQKDDHGTISSQGPAKNGNTKPKANEKNPDAEASSVGETEVGEDFVAPSSAGGGGGELENVPGFAGGQIQKETANGIGAATTLTQEQYQDYLKLPDIGALRFEKAESVCDKDQRVQITNTTVIPWRWNCELLIDLNGDGKADARGTGFLIGECTVMTAGHVVHSGNNSPSGWAKSIQVIPGMNGSSMPFGSYTSGNLRTVTGWYNGANPTHDYGCIILKERPGKSLGYYGFAALSDSSLSGLLVNLAGYPADKAFGTQWYMADRITKVEPRRIHYMIDTYGGQSGSAVYRLSSGQRHAVGIHGYGGCPNKATRIVKPVFDNMLNWRNECK